MALPRFRGPEKSVVPDESGGIASRAIELWRWNDDARLCARRRVATLYQTAGRNRRSGDAIHLPRRVGRRYCLRTSEKRRRRNLNSVRDEEYGGRSFSCRDPEGHLWTIGTYDPWESAED